MARDWHCAKLSQSGALLLPFSGMCDVLCVNIVTFFLSFFVLLYNCFRVCRIDLNHAQK